LPERDRVRKVPGVDVRGIDKDVRFDEADDVVNDAIDHASRTTERLVPPAIA
jgi:hypothetical protein